MFRLIHAAVILPLMMPAVALGDIVFTESFEDAPGASYRLETAFDDGQFDFFGRYAVPDTTNAARDDFATGWDGGFGIIGQDHDGDGGLATALLAIEGIDVSGFTRLSVIVSLGALDSEAAGFDNYELADGDGIAIFATLDGGSRIKIGQFAPPATSANGAANRGDLYLDSDFDGVGTGARLTTDLADFTFDVTGSGSILDLEFELTSTSSFEPLAIDNVRVSAVPEPSSLVALGLIGMVGAYRSRRSRKSAPTTIGG